MSQENSQEKVGVLFVGVNGCVATTVITAARAIAKGLSPSYGLYTETKMSKVKDGKLDRHDQVPIKEQLNLLSFNDLVFGGWDIEEGNAYSRALESKVVPEPLIEKIKEDLQEVEAWPGVFSPEYLRSLEGKQILQMQGHVQKVEKIRQDIHSFKERNRLKQVLVMNVASTEVYHEKNDVHSSLQKFRQGLEKNNPNIGPAQMYAYAALSEGAPYVNFTPSSSEEIPALRELAEETKTPLAGKDGKTGQTLLKTALAPIFRIKNLRVQGWASYNILGNKDGKVLEEPGSQKSKILTKSGVLDQILGYAPYHRVTIDYYPPHGDNKEAWDNVDFQGILGMPMQIKINFLCRDSILAAGSILDLIRLMEYCKRTGAYGIQEQLSFFFKSPTTRDPARSAIHDFFKQEGMLKDWLREKAFGVIYEKGE